MKIFAIYLRLDLTSKPKWFDEFRARYSSSSILHITLIQPRYIDENKIEAIKSAISTILEKSKLDKKLVFVKTLLEQGVLMSFTKENESINILQKDLVFSLKEFSNYCSEETKDYESSFRPHLTIAEGVDQVPEREVYEGTIKDLVLAVVKEQTVAESVNPHNWVIFNIYN